MLNAFSIRETKSFFCRCPPSRTSPSVWDDFVRRTIFRARERKNDKTTVSTWERSFDANVSTTSYQLSSQSKNPRGTPARARNRDHDASSAHHRPYVSPGRYRARPHDDRDGAAGGHVSAGENSAIGICAPRTHGERRKNIFTLKINTRVLGRKRVISPTPSCPRASGPGSLRRIKRTKRVKHAPPPPRGRPSVGSVRPRSITTVIIIILLFYGVRVCTEVVLRKFLAVAVW